VETGYWRWDENRGRWISDAMQANRANGSCRGVFIPRRFSAFKDITDGLSHTIAVGEIATDLGDNDVRTTPHLFTGWNPGVHNNPRSCQPDRDSNRPRFWSSSFTLSRLETVHRQW
jgi:hypothetical protein